MTGVPLSTRLLGRVVPAYAQRRFERLVKVARACVAADISDHRPERTEAVLGAVSACASSLARALLEPGVASAMTSWQGDLPQPTPSWPLGLATAIMKFKHTQHQEALRSWTHAPSHKLGVIGFSRLEILRWSGWLATSLPSRPDVVVGILARGLTDAAIAAHVLGCPLAFVACSHHRLQSRGVTYVSPSLRRCAQSALLVDAHSETGETVIDTLQHCTTLKLSIDAVAITDCEAPRLLAESGFLLAERLGPSVLLRARRDLAGTPS
jgi:hypothetical protein